MLIEILKKHFLTYIYIWYGWIWTNKIVTFQKILALLNVEVSSSPNSLLLYAIAFWSETNKSSLSQIFLKIGVLKSFANFTGKHQCWSLFVVKRLQHRCFSVKFSKFLRILFFTEHLRWLLLNKTTRSFWFIMWRSDTLVISC